MSPNRRFLYVSIELFPEGGVASYAVSSDGSLRLLNKRILWNGGTCHLTLSPDSRWLFAANYRMGRVYQFPILTDGSIGDCAKSLQHCGQGPVRGRQESAHVHCCVVSPDRRFLCTADLGMDALHAYSLTGQGIAEEETVISRILPEGSGPRHLVFSPDGTHAWLLNELENTVMTLDYGRGVFTMRQCLSTLSGTPLAGNKASAIRLSPDGRFLLTTNRGCDTVNVWKIREDSMLERVADFPAGVRSPRDFNFIPGGAKILVGGEEDDSVFCFDFNGRTGTLAPEGIVFKNVPRPICFVPF